MKQTGTYSTERTGSGARIARNSLMLYARMLLLMLISLFTSRVVLAALGQTDYGLYNAVGGMVGVFSFLTASVSAAISRFLSFELGREDNSGERLRRVFSTSVVIMLCFSVLLIVLAETLGLWFLRTRMNLPPGSLPRSTIVLQCSLVCLVLQLLSIPFNAAIIAHEKMSAFALISLLEAALKLAVALLLKFSGTDALVLYAILSACVALAVRLTYSLYCRSHFAETRGRLRPDAALFREMLSFSGWNFFGSSAYVLNTQGVTVLINIFFTLVHNAARGVALQIENMAKQFVSNFLTAINPQITKSWAASDTARCYSLVCKGSKFTFLAIMVFFLPLFFEAGTALSIWLKQVPEYSDLFVRLTLVALLSDMFSNPVLTLILATGKVRSYYLITGLTSYLCLPLVYIAFKLGAGAEWAYICFILIYSIVLVERLWIASRTAGLPVREYLKGLRGTLLATAQSYLVSFGVHLLLPQGVLRFILVCLAAWTSLALFTVLFALSSDERAWLTRKFGRSRVPLRWALEDSYFEVFGRRPDLKNPKTYNEKLCAMMLRDRNPLYHTLVDKAEVKRYAASVIGEQYIIPTLGVWDKVEDIPWESLPGQFVIKCTHDSGSAVVCADKSALERGGVCSKLARNLRRDYWKQSREWAYKGVKPRVIAEQYLGSDIADYKFFCFGGEPRVMFVATDRASRSEETKFDFFDMDFNHLDLRNGHPNASVTPPKPENFELMKELARKLSRGLSQVRVDFYEVDGKVYFGEYTFYHWRGLVPFEPEEWDKKIGELWKE